MKKLVPCTHGLAGAPVSRCKVCKREYMRRYQTPEKLAEKLEARQSRKPKKWAPDPKDPAVIAFRRERMNRGSTCLVDYEAVA